MAVILNMKKSSSKHVTIVHDDMDASIYKWENVEN